ncbi:oligosaccharide flippase family protein [Gracilibacillus alcaliphilus]|uniref:oligosaccharide flippase family protein n=1 Tax=Gracilibacillus alcaliphilus TaxID=1401441 RepID=UPI00195960BB|nr:oligosaccharide flippase family protein [Gracilibacillus alcaliphilus]MBM7678455.1 O-antigen/teichoic acid export membrane protein [Gracilibacillus alcaliphilus]
MNQLRSGVILSYLSLIVAMIVALLYTPIIIRLLGQSEYGLYALIGSFAAYFSVLDLGLGNAIIRYNARNRAIGNENTGAQLNGMFLKLYMIIGLLTVILGVVFYQYIDVIFGNSLTTDELKKGKIMVIILIINFSLSFPLSIFTSIIQAYERFVFVKVVEIVRSVAAPLITLPILMVGYGAVSMVVITTIVNLSLLIYKMYYCFKTLKIKISFEKIDYTLLKEILMYSFFVFLGIVVDQIYWNTDQFILGALLGTLPVAVYAIAMQFVRLYIKFSTSISSLFLPKVSKMIAQNVSNNELTADMIRYGRIQLLIMLFILSGFTLFGRSFIQIWAGDSYKDAYVITLIIMVPLTITLIQNYGISVLYAKNMQKFRSLILIVIAILNIVLSIPLAIKFGEIGVAFATTISLALGNILAMNLFYHYKVGIDMLLFWKNTLKIIPSIIILMFVWEIWQWLVPFDSIYIYLIEISIFSIMYFVTSWRFIMNSYEKQMVKSVIGKLLKPIIKKGWL